MRQFEESFDEITDLFERGGQWLLIVIDYEVTVDSNDDRCYDESPESLRGSILNKVSN